jgi:hypothetical protein
VSFEVVPYPACKQPADVLLRKLLHPVTGLLESRASEVASALSHLEQRTSDKQAATRYVRGIFTAPHPSSHCCSIFCCASVYNRISLNITSQHQHLTCCSGCTESQEHSLLTDSTH